MKLTKVEYEGCFNLGNYENERIRVHAQLEEGDTPEEVVKQLRPQVAAIAGESVQKLWAERGELTSEIGLLRRKLQQAKTEYETVLAFMQAQGLKTEMATFPVSKLLTGASDQTEARQPDSEQVVVIGPDEDDDDEDDYDPDEDNDERY